MDTMTAMSAALPPYSSAPPSPAPPHEVVITVQPPHLAAIAAGTQNTELRGYDVPSTRWWIYEPAPFNALKYVAEVAVVPVPTPSSSTAGSSSSSVDDTVDDAADSSGSDDTDATVEAENAAYAYQILRLEELEPPLPLHELRRRGWLRGAPHTYAFVSDGMRADLESVERRLVFDNRDEDEGDDVAEVDAEIVPVDVDGPVPSPLSCVAAEKSAVSGGEKAAAATGLQGELLVPEKS